MASMTIGELAKTAGVGVETIRFYERKRLIAQPRRPANGYRIYDNELVRRVRFVRQAQKLGFSLAQIRQLLELKLNPRRACADVKAEAEAKIDEIDQKIASLRKMRYALLGITRSCSGEGPISQCPILDALDAPKLRNQGGEIDGFQEG
jgi:MerR family copper efflux transcriptional regulator